MKEERFPTGIPNFDKLIDGGFLPGHKIIVLGSPGSAKTIFSAQFIYNGITKYEDNGIYISTQEKRHDFFRNMQKFGMDFEKLEKQKKFIFIEQGLIRKEFYDVMRILKEAHRINAKRIVWDSLNFFNVKYLDTGIRNLETLTSMRALSGTTRVSLWASENYVSGELMEFRPAHFLGDGLILLRHMLVHKSAFARTVNIIKLRGIKHDDRRFPFTIGQKGVQLKKI